MLEEIALSLDDAEGHACLTPENDVIIFLPTLVDLFDISREYFPFHTIEELFEEFTIHELLHSITNVEPGCAANLKDSIIDSWHILACRLLSNVQRCDCPIDCFFRDRVEGIPELSPKLLRWEI